MATNQYVKHNKTNEQDLFADIVIESIKFYGEDIYYLPRDVVTKDNILNEDVESSFDSSYLVEMYIENTEGFEGEGNLMAKFGLEIRDEATFIVAKRTWNTLVGGLENQIRPLEGDLLYLSLSKSFFEISFVEHEQPFFQLSNLPVFKLQAKLFEYNDEDFNTGVPELDEIEGLGFKTKILLSDVIGTFDVGERVSQTLASGVIVSAKVVVIDSSTDMLTVVDIETSDGLFHEFATGVTVTGSASGAIGTIVSLDDDIGSDYQNDDFSLEAQDVIDFTLDNPFGEPS
tara:strand:- start:1712 stop:2572 length:861 start_codon:yes stop_codon:yes gene_type:complete